MIQLDVLDGFPEISVCIEYKLDGQNVDGFPSSASILERCKPVYKTFPGWQTATTSIKKYEELPENARHYIEYIEKSLERKVEYIGNGAKREDMIVRP